MARLSFPPVLLLLALFAASFALLSSTAISSSTISQILSLRENASVNSANLAGSINQDGSDNLGIEVDSQWDKPSSYVVASQPPSALILTAHPDDEVMFFSPTILNLINGGWNLSAVCLSNGLVLMSIGNADGLGVIRSQELYESYTTLGLTSDKITLIDHPLLQDGINDSPNWDPALIANVLVPILRKNPIDFLITFDSKGITRHPNHVPLPFSHALLPTQGLLSKPTTNRPRLLVLSSPSTLLKFTGPTFALLASFKHTMISYMPTLRPWLSHLTAPVDAVLPPWLDLALRSSFPSFAPTQNRSSMIFISTPAQYIQAVKAMLKHRSQLVWFRWLYLVFSRLMWVNEIIDGGL